MMLTLSDALNGKSRAELQRERDALLLAARAAIRVLVSGPLSIADSPQMRGELAAELLRAAITKVTQ